SIMLIYYDWFAPEAIWILQLWLSWEISFIEVEVKNWSPSSKISVRENLLVYDRQREAPDPTAALPAARSQPTAMKWAGEDYAGIYGLRWIREGETVSFCSNAPASPCLP